MSQTLLALNNSGGNGRTSGAHTHKPGDAATVATSPAIWLVGKRYRSALGVYLGTVSTGDDVLNNAPGNLFGHLDPNLVENDTLLIGCHAALFELKFRSVNDGKGRPQLGMQAHGLRTRQAQESFCAIDFRYSSSVAMRFMLPITVLDHWSSGLEGSLS